MVEGLNELIQAEIWIRNPTDQISCGHYIVKRRYYELYGGVGGVMIYYFFESVHDFFKICIFFHGLFPGLIYYICIRQIHVTNDHVLVQNTLIFQHNISDELEKNLSIMFCE